MSGVPVGDPIPPKRVKQKKVRVFSAGDIIGFGKHRADTIEQVFRSDPGWIKWALQNVETFALESVTLEKLNPSDPVVRIGNALQALNFQRAASATEKGN